MEENKSVKSVKESIKAAMELPKCRKCGCMKESLETMKNELFKMKSDKFSELLDEIENAMEKMEPVKYT